MFKRPFTQTRLPLVHAPVGIQRFINAPIVKIGEVELVEGKDYTFDTDDGKFTICYALKQPITFRWRMP